MQSSELVLEQRRKTTTIGWLERLSWSERLPAAFAFGCLLGLSCPGFDQWWLAWIGLVPLLVLLRSVGGFSEAALVGLTFGMGYNLVALSWYLGLFPLRWLGLGDWLGVQAAGIVWLFESMHESLLIAAFATLTYSLPTRSGYLPFFRRPYFPYVLSVPLIWIFLQWVVATSELFVGLPVNQLAYSQHNQLQLIQIAKLGGSGLVDFLLVLSNCAIASFILENAKIARRLEDRIDQISPRVGSFVDVAVVAVLVSLAVSWGRSQVEENALSTHPDNLSSCYQQIASFPVGVVQGNVTIEEDRLKTSTPEEIANRYSSLSTNKGVSLLVFPEGLINAAQMAPGMLLSRLKSLAVNEKKEIVVGTIESFGHGLVNAGRIIAPKTPKQSLYVKRRLVPFGEFAPLGSWGQNIQTEVKSRIPGSNESFLAAKKTSLIKSMWGDIGVSICVEMIYPRLIADEVRHGASLLVNLSNLGWFHGSALNKQMLAAAQMRAVENGRFMVVATNTGISAVIDPAGMVTSMSYPNKRGVLLDTVQCLYKETPFSRMWWL
jgi:apolipoprotein N-acyltransferase